MKMISLVLFLLIASGTYSFPLDSTKALETKGEEHDYYWRPYYGLVPEDAVEGTYDGYTRTYVGSVHIFGQGIYVGQLVEGEKSITVILHKGGAVVRETEQIFILCSGHPENFKWFPTSWDNLGTVPYHKVIAGSETTENQGLLYPGRATYSGKLIIGKVAGYNTQHLDWNSLYIPHGEEQLSLPTFEILTYVTD